MKDILFLFQKQTCASSKPKKILFDRWGHFIFSAKSPLKPTSGAVPAPEISETTDPHLSGCLWVLPVDGSMPLLIPVYQTTPWSLRIEKATAFSAENQSNNPGAIGL